MSFVYFCAIIVFCLGCAVGSFLNVCIYRLPIGKSVLTPPSHCPRCNTHLKWVDLVPLLSSLFLGRKCRYCKAPISWRYFGVELLTGVLYSAIFLTFGFCIDTVFYLIFATFLVAGAFVDIDHMIIPDSVVVCGLIVGFCMDMTHYFMGDLIFVNLAGIRLLPSLIGSVLCAGVFYLLAFWGDLFFRPRGAKNDDNYCGALGLGDVSLAAAIGAVIGFLPALISFLIAIVLGAVCGIIWILFSRRAEKRGLAWREPIPFGPYMVLGVFCVMFFSDKIIAVLTWWLGLL